MACAEYIIQGGKRMKTISKHIAVLICLVMTIAMLGGCSSNTSQDGSNGNSEYQETITIAPSLDFTGTDVQKNSGGTAKSVFVMVYDTLIGKDTMKNELVPGLATSWNQLSDTIWEFNLREGVKFHDGSDFKAEDVKFTIERGKTQSSSKGKLTSVVSVKIVDDYTIQIELDPVDCDIIYKLSEPNTSILSATAFANMDEEEANKIGTGPYMYDEWLQGDYLSLVKYENFWGTAAKTQKVIVRYIPEAASRLIALQTGEIDICVDPPSIDLHYIAEDENLKLLQINSSTLRIVMLNTLVKPFDNEKVRQAVAFAINREDFVTAVYEGNATPCNNIMNPTNEFYKEIEGYSFDLDKAKALLTEAGFPNGFSTTIYSSSGTIQKTVATVLQAQLSKIGIKADIQSLETATFNNLAVLGGDCPILIDGWGGYTVGPDNAIRSFFYSTASYNEGNINDPELDRMLDEAIAEGNLEARKNMYYEIQEYATNLAVMLPIAVEQINVGMKSSLEGFELPDGLFHHWRNLFIPLD